MAWLRGRYLFRWWERFVVFSVCSDILLIKLIFSWWSATCNICPVLLSRRLVEALFFKPVSFCVRLSGSYKCGDGRRKAFSGRGCMAVTSAFNSVYMFCLSWCISLPDGLDCSYCSDPDAYTAHLCVDHSCCKYAFWLPTFPVLLLLHLLKSCSSLL